MRARISAAPATWPHPTRALPWWRWSQAGAQRRAVLASGRTRPPSPRRPPTSVRRRTNNVCKVLLPFLLASVSLAQPKLAVLIVDGVNNHDWQTATRELRAILASTGRFQVDVSTSPPRDAAPEAWQKWRPHFDAYQAVLLNWNGGHLENGLRWPAEVASALLQYVRSVGGL